MIDLFLVAFWLVKIIKFDLGEWSELLKIKVDSVEISNNSVGNFAKEQQALK